MEAANEAARRAVNAILTKTNSTQTPASVWPMQEPDCFKALIEYDRLRFRMGLPHTSLGLGRVHTNRRASTMRANCRKARKTRSSFSKREKMRRKPLSLRKSRSISLRFL
jgi:hypothetical protein